MRLLLKLLPLIGLIFLAENAHAALPPLGGFLPGAAQPETVSRALTRERLVQAPVASSATIAPPQQLPSKLDEQARKIKFKLSRVILQGNHTFSQAELSSLYKDKLHKMISIADLFSIVQAITNYYRNHGYIISRAVLPPQHVKGGVVQIRIIEGYLDKVTVSGDPKGAATQVKALGCQMAACRPLLLNQMETYLLLANELPQTQVKAVLSPSKAQTGAADLTLVTQHHHLSGYLSYDNYGTRYIGPQQMTANLQINSWIRSGDASQLTVTKTPKGGELTFIDINENLPIDDRGTRWLIGATRAHTHPLFVLRPAQIDGLNNNYYTTLFYPLIRSRNESLTLRTGFNYLDSEVTTIADLELYNDHLRSLDVGGTYNFTDNWYGANMFSLDVRQGLPILGYTSNYNPVTAKSSRPGARGDYTKMAATISRLQGLYQFFSLFALAQGQWSANPLLASEQFTFGGSQLGRGYDVAELIADRGVAASVELRYDLPIEKFLLHTLQFYIFSDGAMVWNKKNIPGTPRKDNAISAGGGLRFFATKYLSGNIMWAQPLTRKVLALTQEQQVNINGQIHNEGNGAAPRVFFSVVASF